MRLARRGSGAYRGQETQVPDLHAGSQTVARLAEELSSDGDRHGVDRAVLAALWNLLEGEFDKLILVNPQHIKGLNGYKTDPKDAQWIADLLEGGKLRGSWVPERPLRELRDLTRQRVHTLEDLNRVKNRIEQLCQTGNIKVSSVATDLFGISGRKMLQGHRGRQARCRLDGGLRPGHVADRAVSLCEAPSEGFPLNA